MIAIVDYQMGNLGSIGNMLKKLGAQAVITSEADKLMRADKLILPGVGAFDHGMQNIERLGLRPILDKKVLEEKTPILGICLGMQLITRRSQEGSLPGLGWVQADTIRFSFNPNGKLKIPHMGWNHVTPNGAHPLFRGLESEARFYFVHSYHAACDRREDVLALTSHGYEFAAAIGRDNIMGTQFHPEKSHKFGLRLLDNFVRLI